MIIFLRSALLLAHAGPTMAQQLQNLYLSSYAGNLTRLSYDVSTDDLTTASTDNGCGPNPTWLTLDKSAGALYCLGEGTASLTINGSITSYSVCPATGRITPKSHQDTVNGPVSSTVYRSSQGAAAIALAHYGGSAVSTFSIDGNLNLSRLQDLPIAFPNAPGPNKDRQGAAHAHEAILDPTGKFLLVPDLGKDQVHVFNHDPSTNMLNELDPLIAKPGSGPRHAAFWSPASGSMDEKTKTMFLYLVAELDATVTSYKVTYKANDGGLQFDELFASDTLGADHPKAGIVAPAEIAVSPDNQYLLVSNRNDSTYQNFPNPDTTNKTTITSDSIASWKLAANGSLEHFQLAPVGGRFPRQFQINPDGDRVAVVLQNDNHLSILERDVKSGKLGAILAYVATPDQPTCVVWG